MGITRFTDLPRQLTGKGGFLNGRLMWRLSLPRTCRSDGHGVAQRRAYLQAREAWFRHTLMVSGTSNDEEQAYSPPDRISRDIPGDDQAKVTILRGHLPTDETHTESPNGCEQD